MSERRASSWPGWLLILVGAGMATAAGLLVTHTKAPTGGEDPQVTAEALHARIEQALRTRSHALEPRASEAAGLPALVSGLDLGADAHTFEDLLQTEDWWAPLRSEFTLSGLVGPTGPLAMLGPPVGDLAKLPVVRQAREVGVASGIVALRDRAFVVGAARVARSKRYAGGAVVVLGAQLEHATFQSLADGTSAAIGLADGAHVIESGGAEALRPALSELVAKQVRGVAMLEPGRAGAAWPLDGGLALLAAFPAAPPPAPPPLGAALAVAALGLLIGLGGMMIIVARRRGAAAPAVAAAVSTTGVGAVPSAVGSDGSAARLLQSSTGSGGIVIGQPSRPFTTGQMTTVPTNVSGPIASGALAVQMTRTDPALAAPITMGRYRLLERIGEGGMAEIFIAATHGVEGFVRHFVVKRMHPHLARNRDAVNQFIDEARLQSALVHSNIVPVFDFGMAGDEYFMALEYINGRDLDVLVRRHMEVFKRPLSAPVAFYIMHDVLEALAYAHAVAGEDGNSLQIVHRDVTPGNILVSFRGEVKLSDFGIAKAQSRVSQTELGMVKGNASFMSPEQARGEAVDARSDLFSAGLVLYYCLTGQLMYGEGDAVVKKLMRAAAGLAQPELLQLDKVPVAAANVLRRALALDPSQRYQEAREFAADLVGYFTSGRGELSALMTQLFPEKRRRVDTGPPI
jgi:hypothetical protein